MNKFQEKISKSVEAIVHWFSTYVLEIPKTSQKNVLVGAETCNINKLRLHHAVFLR